MCIRYNRELERIERWVMRMEQWVPYTRKPRQYKLDGESFPGSVAPIAVLEDGQMEILMATWGLQPIWTKDPKFGRKNAYNARSETIAEKPAFRTAIRERRCLIPATEFYERTEGRWIRFHAPNEEAIVFAGLFEPPNHGSTATTFAMVTTEPNECVAEIHDRMPVILAAADIPLWMDSSTSLRDLTAMMTPCPEEWLTWDDAGPIRPEPQGQGSLF